MFQAKPTPPEPFKNPLMPRKLQSKRVQKKHRLLGKKA
jgi:hypothetical protein